MQRPGGGGEGGGDGEWNETHGKCESIQVYI